MKIPSNGIEIHCVVEGEGPWVVLSHSLACNLGMWDELAAFLRSRYRVLRFDTRGHGGSAAPEGPYSMDMLADDLEGLLDRMQVADPHFVGLSMGGMIGMTHALKYPGRFRSLVLCDTTSRIPAEAVSVWEGRIRTAREQGMEPLVDPTLRRWFTEPFVQGNAAMMARVGGMIRNTPVGGYVGCCDAISRLDMTARLGVLRIPVQVVVGEEDAGTPVAMSRAIHDAIAGSELVILPSASHLSNLEQPAAFNAAVAGFIGRH